MTDENTRLRLKQALTNLDSLPAMPATAQKLLVLPLDTDEGEAQMLRLIGQDPQISTKIISLANSPVMGVPRKLSKVSDAAMLLGLSRVKSVAVGIAEHTGEGIEEYEWMEPGIDPAEAGDICAQANELAVQAAQLSSAF